MYASDEALIVVVFTIVRCLGWELDGFKEKIRTASSLGRNYWALIA